MAKVSNKHIPRSFFSVVRFLDPGPNAERLKKEKNAFYESILYIIELFFESFSKMRPLLVHLIASNGIWVISPTQSA
jgi:hypothetical protein